MPMSKHLFSHIAHLFSHIEAFDRLKQVGTVSSCFNISETVIISQRLATE